MMNELQLQLLDASARRNPVLSIYLALDTASAPDRRRWSLDLEHALRPLRERLAASTHLEREHFEATVGHAEEALRGLAPDTEGATWIAFVTPAGVRHSELVGATMPTIIGWGEGIRLAPYLRVLNDDVPVVVVVSDSAHLDLWEYRSDHCRLIERIHARQPANHEAAHLGAAPAQGFHAGTRGGVGRDEWQRQRRDGTLRMLELGAERARQLAGAHGWVCVSGIPHVAKRLVRLIALGGRGQIVKLDVHATAAEIAVVARDALRTLGERRVSTEVRATIDSAVPLGLGVLGPAETLEALEHGRVKELYVSERFLRDHLDEAEVGVRHARRQGARTVVVMGGNASALDDVGGLAARLRYRQDGSAAPVRTA